MPKPNKRRQGTRKGADTDIRPESPEQAGNDSLYQRIRSGFENSKFGIFVILVVLFLGWLGSDNVIQMVRSRLSIGRLVMGPHSVTYDPALQRITAVLNVQNDGNRYLVMSITNSVWIDSQKQPQNPDRSKPQPWRTELVPKQFSPVIYMIDGADAVAIWSGKKQMELRLDAEYDARPGKPCNFSFRGRFESAIQQVAMLESNTTPIGCLDM